MSKQDNVVFAKAATDQIPFSESLDVRVNDRSSVLTPTEQAPAYRLGNLLSLPQAGKWRGHAFQGMVVPRAKLERPGVDLGRLLRLHAIFPATLEELAAYESRYGESRETIEARERELRALKRELRERTRAARKRSAVAALLRDLIREWSIAENECRRRWHGTAGCLMGKSEEQARRYYLDRESDLLTLAGREDLYIEAIKELARPILISAAGMGIDISPLDRLLTRTSFQDSGWDRQSECQARDWLEMMKYRLLAQEEESKSVLQRCWAGLCERGWTLFWTVLTAIAIAGVFVYLRGWGIELR